MKIALFPKESDKKLTDEVIKHLGLLGATVVIGGDHDPNTIDLIITMGGDGSILRAAHHPIAEKAPLLGINLGHLGFMADVQVSEMKECLHDLIKGAYTVEERVMLEGKFPNLETFYAINDCVLHRARNPSLVQIEITVDGRLLNTFEADGIIVATPNGSTAYSLAAGGPILSPTLDAVVITPICPHTISNRPIVLSPNKEIRLTYTSEKEPIECVADGITHFEVASGETLSLRKSARTFKLVSLDRIDAFSTLRHKLNWVGKLR